MKVVLLVLSVVALCAGRRVLVVFSAPGRSHTILGDSIVNILLKEGHEVTYVTPYPKETKTPGLTYVNISSTLGELTADQRLNTAQLMTSPRPAHRLLTIGPSFCRRALLHQAVQELLLDPDISFDVVIGEWFASGLLAPLGSVFNCPFIWYNPTEVHWLTLRLIDEPSNPAYHVDLQSRSMPTVPFTFWEKAHQLWMRVYLTAWTYYITNYVEVPAYQEIYSAAMHVRGRSLPDYESLVHNASLQLVNVHPPLTQPLAVPPNLKYVGGHHIELPTKPLPENLQKVLDNASEGAIFFSLGSNLKSKDFPEHMKRELVAIFAQLGQIILWKFEEKIDNLPSNVHILDWAPQTSILNHPNTILFISHGGLLSVTESVHYGVPIIGIPFFGDQFLNVDLTVARGIGLRVDFNYDLPVKIKEGIHEILGNSSYSKNAQQASTIFHNRLASPQRELAHWVRLVMDTRGAPHLRSLALRVPIAERLHLDILAVIFLILWFISKLIKVVKVHLTESEDIDKKNI